MEYSTAKSIRGRTLSSLITQKIRAGGGVTSAIRSSVSEKMRAKGLGIKEKFDPLNIAKFLTGGSNLAPAILGRLTGRKQSDINYFSGGRKTATEIKKTKSLGQLPGDSSGSLSEIFNLIKKNYERDLQLRETERSFQEEKANEDQRRHNEFIKVLKDYTSGGTAIAIKPEKEGGGLLQFLDMVKSMIAESVKNTIDTIQNMFSWLNDLRKSGLFKLIGSNLLTLLTSQAFLAAASAGALFYLLASDKNPEQTTKQILGAVDPNALGSAIDKQQQENVSPEELNKKFEVRRALLKDAPFKTKYFGIGQREYLTKLGVPQNEVEQLYDDTKPLVVPEVLKDINPQVYNKLKPSAKPVNSQSKLNVGEAGQVEGTSETPSRTTTPQNKTETAPTSTEIQTPISSVPSTPMSSSVYGASEENNNLNMMATATSSTPMAPIVSNNVNNTSTEESIPATATVRDKVAILERVFSQSTAMV
jgi:hypothetical protein